MEDHVDDPGVNSLPDELLLQVFAQLSRQDLGRSARVCKRWKRVSYDASLYKSVRLSRPSYELGTLGFVLARGTERLEIRGQSNADAFKVPIFLDEMEPGSSYRLQQLINGKLYKGLPLILQRCRHLTDLRLVIPALDPDLVLAIAEIPGLEHVRIITYDERPFEETIAIIRGCRRLRVFNCRGLDHTLDDQEMYQIAKELPPTIEETNLFCTSPTTTDEHVALLVKNLPNLVELHLQHCPRLTEKSVQHISKLQNLKKLNITFSRSIPVDAFRPLKRVKSLKTLAFYDAVHKSDYQALRSMLPNVALKEEVDIYSSAHFYTFWD